MRGVPRQVIDIPLTGGLRQKSDSRALDVPGMAEVIDAEFDEVGGLQTRKPFVNITSHASNTIGDIRRLAVYEDELIAFTQGEIYSYSSGDGRWTKRADYLAPKLTERSRFVNNAEQYDCDRAERGGVTLFTWSQNVDGTVGTYVAAIDTASGAVVLTPEIVAGSAQRPRAVATTNRLMLVYIISTTVYVREYDPADMSTSAEVSHSLGTFLAYDVCVDGTDVVFAASQNTSYYVRKVGEGPALGSGASKSRAAGTAISIDVAGNGRFAVAREDATNIDVDILNNSLTDSTASAAVWSYTASVLDQLTLKFRSVTDGGYYRAYVFWAGDQDDNAEVDFKLEYNWVDTNGDTGLSISTLAYHVGLGSHAFDHNGEVYVWVSYALISQAGNLSANVNNAYFLYRDDGTLIARSAANVGGGYATNTGHLPGVQDLGSNQYGWCGIERRRIALGQEQRGYEARAPREIILEMDSDEARRTVQLGKTLYIAGAQVAQYDGRTVVELGFPAFPATVGYTSQAAGSLTGAYYYKCTAAWQNAAGEREESTTATYYERPSASSNQHEFTPIPVGVTLKSGAAGEITLQYWRNQAGGGEGAPFYLITSVDPTTASGDNRYCENEVGSPDLGTTFFIDDMSDATLISKRQDPETGGILASTAPPPASVIHATQDRIFLAGISDAPNRVVYSRLRSEGEIASFNDNLAVELPPGGGDITGLGFLNETLIVFKQNAIYALPGDGYDNAGGGNNYGPARLLSSDVGASTADAIALTPKGILFHSDKGWYLLNQGWQAAYVGAAVSDYDSDTWVSAHVMESQHQVRVVSTSRVLVWDYYDEVNAWAEWSVADALHSVMWNGVQHYAVDDANDDEVAAQEANWDNNTAAYGLDVETPWLKLSGLQNYQSMRRLLILGEYRSACALRVRIAYNYEENDASGVTWVDDKVWTISPTTVGGPLQLRHTPSRRKAQSIKIRISARNTGDTDFPTGEALKLTGLALEVGMKRGPFRQLPAAQKQ